VTPRGRVGLVGGSGVSDLASIAGAREETLDTPFGPPSGPFVTGTLDGIPVAFLSRHGPGHRLTPSEVNYRANIFGFKRLGCDAVLSASAVGSLREEYAPRHALVPDQFLDRTRRRRDTFFGEGVAAHATFADPICPEAASALAEAARASGLAVTRGGVYVCIEGPVFSTRAESALYRSWGADVIGMTNATEAKLAREAELCYATLALVTDYDAWREATEPVTVDMILAVLRENSAAARRAMRDAVGRLDSRRACGCRDAMRFSILTDRSAIAPEAKRRLEPIVGRYL
jgi:5'-methylthioadenosine phosphorylase